MRRRHPNVKHYIKGEGINGVSHMNAGRLFTGSCAAVATLACSFASLSGVMFHLKEVFLLDNVQIGLIGGAFLAV
jgi:hypothetical protein